MPATLYAFRPTLFEEAFFKSLKKEIDKRGRGAWNRYLREAAREKAERDGLKTPKKRGRIGKRRHNEEQRHIDIPQSAKEEIERVIEEGKADNIGDAVMYLIETAHRGEVLNLLYRSDFREFASRLVDSLKNESDALAFRKQFVDNWGRPLNDRVWRKLLRESRRAMDPDVQSRRSTLDNYY